MNKNILLMLLISMLLLSSITAIGIDTNKAKNKKEIVISTAETKNVGHIEIVASDQTGWDTPIVKCNRKDYFDLNVEEDSIFNFEVTYDVRAEGLFDEAKVRIYEKENEINAAEKTITDNKNGKLTIKNIKLNSKSVKEIILEATWKDNNPFHKKTVKDTTNSILTTGKTVEVYAGSISLDSYTSEDETHYKFKTNARNPNVKSPVYVDLGTLGGFVVTTVNYDICANPFGAYAYVSFDGGCTPDRDEVLTKNARSGSLRVVKFLNQNKCFEVFLRIFKDKDHTYGSKDSSHGCTEDYTQIHINKVYAPSTLSEDKEGRFVFQTNAKFFSDAYLKIDWGDGTDTGWMGPKKWNAEYTERHSWSSVGEYTITVDAKTVPDAFGHENPAETKTYKIVIEEKKSKVYDQSNILCRFQQKCQLIMDFLDNLEGL